MRVLKIQLNKLFFSLEELVKRYKRSRLRKIMRGYSILKESGQMDKIPLVKQAITEHCLELNRKVFSSVVMGAGAEWGEIIVRQYLLIRIGGQDLNRALLIASASTKGKVVFPMPGVWREVLTQHGFSVAKYRSAFLWQIYLFAHILHGMQQIVRIAFTGLSAEKKNGPVPNPYAFFVELSSGNLPKKIHGSHSYDVVSWYLQWYGRNKEIVNICHNVADTLPVIIGNISVHALQGQLPALTEYNALVKFVVWGLKASVISSFDCFRGRWWHALLLNQAAMAAQVRLLPDSSLAREYLFHNSNWIYRPLWTYEAVRKGSDVLLYFYSTNCESFKRSDGYPQVPFGWKAINWPRYIVWDQYQADFVRRAAGKECNISVVGEIWFSDTAMAVQKLPEGSVAVFDVQPVRSSFYVTLGADIEYYTPATAIQFLEDIQVVLHENNCLLALKRKRNIGKLAHAQYRSYIDKLGCMNNYVAVDPDVSASLLVQECKAVISMPYTSTALLGRNLGKPSIYYDPTGLLQKDDRAAHGIEIVQGRTELATWLKGIL